MKTHPYTSIAIENWERKSTFEFFSTFDSPFYNITAPVNVTKLKSYCKKHNYSFFLATLFISQKVINQIPNFRYRLFEGEVRDYNYTQAGSTVLLDNNTFSFCYFEIESDFKEFIKKGELAIQNLKSNPDFEPRQGDLNMIFYSVIPWISFTSFQHARKNQENDSVPRIVFGKYYESNNEIMMPVSIEVHHALVDGLHVGQYFELFEKEINQLVI
jgi:chloramphenicol O-acetyltransferase type A